MAEQSPLDFQLKSILRCVPEKYDTIKAVRKEHSGYHPKELEAIIWLSNKVRKLIFKERPDPGIEELLDKLVDLGYVERCTSTIHPITLKRTKREVTYYKRTMKAYGVFASTKRRR